MNLTINRLPAKTWNRLGMNEVKVSLEDEYKNHTPEAAFDPEQISWNPAAEALFAGAAGDLEELTAGADLGLAETKPGVVMEKPLILTYDYAEGEKGISRLMLHAGEKSTMEVVVLLKSQGKDIVSGLQTYISAEEDAVVNLHLVQLLSRDSLCFNHIAGLCGDRAKVKLVRLELGSQKTFSGVNVDLKGKDSNFETKLGYHGKPGQVMDMNYVALHHGVRTNSLMEISGTLEEGAKKIFRGSIDFQRGCAGAKGTETENVLLMADDVVNQTIPLILCQEEDVEGNHGASIGQLDDKVLFYMGSRGISREAAQQMIAEARIQAVCDQIPDADVQQMVRDYESIGGDTHEAEL